MQSYDEGQPESNYEQLLSDDEDQPISNPLRPSESDLSSKNTVEYPQFEEATCSKYVDVEYLDEVEFTNFVSTFNPYIVSYDK